MSPNQLYFLDSCRHKIKPTAIIDTDNERLAAQQRGHIEPDGKLSEGAVFILDEFETFLVKTKKIVASEVLGDDGLAKIKEYRLIFPSERLPSGEFARTNIPDLKKKFIWFFKTYPEFDWDLVLNATDYYKHLKEKEGFKFMMNSSYFIQKTDPTTKIARSALADMCQNILDDPNFYNQE
jgi:hypothetical protein